MAGLLEGQLAKAIYAGFKGKLLKGTLRRMDSGDSGGVDALGDDLATAPLTYALEGFPDKYSAFYRAQAGIPDSDVKVCIFAASLPAGIKPSKDDQVALRRNGVATWYQLRENATDPAEALWECQAFEIPEPEDA